MPGNPIPLSGLLGSVGLASIHAQLEGQERLLRAVRQGLPDFLRGHCPHCVAKDDRLVLYVDSPAFASQVRFFGPSLLAHLEQATGQRFRDIQIRNLLPAAPRPGAKRPITPPAPGITEMLRATADNSSSGEIRDALVRLSQTLDRLRRG
jgi:hypothetical protein